MTTIDHITEIRKFQQSLLAVTGQALYFEVMLAQLNLAGAPYQLQLYQLSNQWIFKSPGGGRLHFMTTQFEEAVGTFLAALVTEVQNAARTSV
jgi:hypothetical protein